jgi:hypothetical protein
MRTLLFGCLLGLGLAASTGADAQAQDQGLFPWQVSRNHPWCAFYSSGMTECLYANVAQCRASVSGVGGYCYQNPAYVAPPPPPPRRARARRAPRS